MQRDLYGCQKVPASACPGESKGECSTFYDKENWEGLYTQRMIRSEAKQGWKCELKSTE